MPRGSVGELEKRSLAPTHLRAWRNFHGYSLEAAAHMIGITHGLLSRIERGLKPYNQRFLESAAEAYKCSPADLVSRDPSEQPEISIFDLALGDRQKVIEYMRGLRLVRERDEGEPKEREPLAPPKAQPQRRAQKDS